jgi:hypothetical protein
VDVALGRRELHVAGVVADVDERDLAAIREAADPRVPQRVEDDLAVLRGEVAGLAERSRSLLATLSRHFEIKRASTPSHQASAETPRPASRHWRRGRR